MSTKRHNIVACLWDESFLWGIMAYDAMRSACLSLRLIRSSDIKNGALNDFRVLFVPGGWASNKMKSIGGDGVEEIRKFVREGGSYVGFCGGAGLATNDGLCLLNIDRMPTRERVPSFSGRINLDVAEHPVFDGITEPVFHAWWPSQFLLRDMNIKVLARYGNAMPDAFSSDLNVGDVSMLGSWETLEDEYKIRLDPLRLKGEPAVIEGTYGEGRIILSLVHFDTPDDPNGQTVLKNIMSYLGLEGRIETCPTPSATTDRYNIIHSLYQAAADLIIFGERNFLWYWRTPMLLQWRRGVRGLEYCTLYNMLKKIDELAAMNQAIHISGVENNISVILEKLRPKLDMFINGSKRLLFLERQAMLNSRITYEKCDEPQIRELRTMLFSSAKSYGGLFKEVIDLVDEVMYILLGANNCCPSSG